MMNCGDARNLLNAEIDGELAPPEAGGVRGHLAGCPACRARHAMLTSARDAFRETARGARSRRRIAVAAISGALAIAMVAAWMRTGAPRSSVTTAPVMAPSARPAVDGGAAPDVAYAAASIDCGRAGAVVCVEDRPCADQRCAPVIPGIGVP